MLVLIQFICRKMKKKWEEPNYEILDFCETKGVSKESVIFFESTIPETGEDYFGAGSMGPS